MSQGRITITAKYLNINGLIQSGTDDVSVDISAGFAPPPQTTALADAFNNPLAGITFGDGIPVDGYWDAANQRIVIEEIVPQGGEIILAGQIISTGNGLLRVANGYTNVTINNRRASTSSSSASTSPRTRKAGSRSPTPAPVSAARPIRSSAWNTPSAKGRCASSATTARSPRPMPTG